MAGSSNNKGNSSSAHVHGENEATFEESFARLQEVVRHLSEGNLSLQEALEAFEEGMELAGRCSGMLDQAELRVKQVSDRALRAGSAALAELDMAMRGTPAPPERQVVQIVEVETTETTLLFDAPPRKPAAPKAVQPPARPEPASSALLDDLDPLFDEDD